MTKLIPIKLSFANAYLVLGDRPIIVDTGTRDDVDAIIAAIEHAGASPRDVSLILLTHAHWDHAGSAKALRQITGAPIALHAADGATARQGHSDALTVTRWTAQVMKPFLNRPFDAFEPDIALDEHTSLENFGVDGRVIQTSGHTAGSVSVLVGDEAIVGDVMMGGHLGGAWQPTQPRLHYFAEDLAAVHKSIAHLIALAPRTMYVGHGGPLALADVVRVFDRRGAMNRNALPVD